MENALHSPHFAQSMPKIPYFIVTGGVGFGKTSIVDFIAHNFNISTVPEIAADLIREELAQGGKSLPWHDRLAFETLLLEKKIAAYEAAQPLGITLFDRGIPDALAFMNQDCVSVPDRFYVACERYRYNGLVFVTPPWKHIFHNDAVRPQTYEQSVRLDRHIRDSYSKLGYTIVDIPVGTIKYRSQFLMRAIDNSP
jgi:predicted ATPase